MTKLKCETCWYFRSPKPVKWADYELGDCVLTGEPPYVAVPSSSWCNQHFSRSKDDNPVPTDVG